MANQKAISTRVDEDLLNMVIDFATMHGLTIKVYTSDTTKTKSHERTRILLRRQAHEDGPK